MLIMSKIIHHLSEIVMVKRSIRTQIQLVK